MVGLEPRAAGSEEEPKVSSIVMREASPGMRTKYFMDKSIILKKFIEELRARKDELERSYLEHKEEAKNAPSAMQSASDMSRHQANTMAENVRAEIDVLEKAIDFLLKPESHPKEGGALGYGDLFIVEYNSGKKGYLIVPKGAGGREVKGLGIDLFSISPNSPIGEKLIRAKIGENVKLHPNEPETKVVNIL